MSINKLSTIIIGVIIFVFVSYCALIIVLTWPITVFSIDKAGVFGDSFGIITALFSALAFGGVLIAILIQKEDLKLTREEIATQHIDNTFFQLLNLHNDIVNDIDLQKTKSQISQIQITRGRDCFKTFHQRLRNKYTPFKDESKELIKIENAYGRFFKENQAEVGHYFRNLYNLIKFVHKSEMEDKQRYVNIARAQLSSYELSLLFYNALYFYSQGREKFKALIEEYALLENMDFDHLFKKEHKGEYNKGAYIEKDREIILD